MAYRYDSDLEFLKRLSSSDLKDLFDVLVYAEDGQKRVNEYLTHSEEYKKHGDNYAQYTERIAEELQYYGSNSFANLFRGKGVLYKKILCDVCDHLKVNYNEKSETSLIEQNMLAKILEKSLEEMSDEEKREVGRELDIKNIDSLSKQALSTAFLGLLKTDDFHAYQLTTSIANAVAGKTLGGGLKAVAGKVVLTKTLGILAGPIGWAITGALVSVSLAGPAYRVTVPACFVVAALRKKLKAEQEARLKAEQEAKQKANKTKKMWYLTIIFLISLVILAVFFFIKREHQPSNNASNSQPSAIQKIDAKNPNLKNHKKSNSHSKAQNHSKPQKQ
ncbi:hypothetical protein HPPN120_08035 [Helicobacter pylori Puno120]|uniref:DUF3944 domain-containing protein n=1 Tax=Helicobacter pylori TaxID=210 RepID=UPI000229136B|nr:DUF3944 domain-containing protein [Helicobacter pylori]AEN16178.1 hypothetical protein HPPN120_08035 [Helicobacter pylori Puno120]